MVNTGASAKLLAGQVSDPTAQIAVQREAICLKKGIPVRIFLGSERGELASSQDKDTWNGRLHGRQVGYLTPKVIIPLIDRLIQAGVLPKPKDGKFFVDWPDLSTLTSEQQAAIALQRTQALVAFISGGCEQYIQLVTWLVRFLDIPQEVAQEMLDESLKAQQNQDRIGDETGQFDKPEPPMPQQPGEEKEEPEEQPEEEE